MKTMRSDDIFPILVSGGIFFGVILGALPLAGMLGKAFTADNLAPRAECAAKVTP